MESLPNEPINLGPPLTRADALRKVYEHFVISRAPKALYTGEACVYHLPGHPQIACAIGCLVPEEHRENVFGSFCGGINTFLGIGPRRHLLKQFLKIETDEDREFYSRLQELHDRKFMNVSPTDELALVLELRNRENLIHGFACAYGIAL